MKNIKLFALLLLLAGCYVQQPVAVVSPPPPPPPQPAYTPPPPPQPPASYQTFYDQLAPYGSWVTYQNYGYVWIPNVDPGFRPYCTNGYWAYSDVGWTWVSYYEWGWAPFHYGRWLSDPYYGWIWVPGNDWAPAWVTWGNYNGYYGWAPIAPGYNAGEAYYPPVNNWCFVQARYVGNSGWGNNYYVASNNRIMMDNGVYIENVRTINVINNTNNYNSRVYNAGPPRAEIENVTGSPVRTVAIRENNTPGKTQISNGSLSIYRPQVSSESHTSGATARPVTVVPIEKVHPQQQNAPARQQEKAPAINRENNSSGQTAPKPQFQQPQENMNRKPEETQQPAAKPQQQAPRQENIPAAQPARVTQTAPPAQKQQPAKPAAKRTNKPAKVPVKPKPQPQEEQKDKTVPR